MTKKTRKTLSALSFATLCLCLVGGVALAQTKQLKAPANAQNSKQDDAAIQINDENSSSSSVVIETHTTPDGKVVQSKKVWSNGVLVEEEEKELEQGESDDAFNATIQLPNGAVAPGGIFLSEDGEDIFGGVNSPLEALRKMEEQMRIQQEQMRAQFDALRSRLANGQNAAPLSQDDATGGAIANGAIGVPGKYWIGATISSLPDILVSQMPINSDEGVLVEFVVPDSPAAKAGLKRFDVVHSLDGRVLKSAYDVSKFVQEIGAKKVKIEYYRKGKLETADIEIAERPSIETINSSNPLRRALPDKKFQVVRPGVIIPSIPTDENAASAEQADEVENETTEPAADGVNEANDAGGDE